MDDKLIDAWVLRDPSTVSLLFDSREAAERWWAECGPEGASMQLCAAIEWERLRRLIDSADTPVASLPSPEQPPLNEYNIGELVLVDLSDEDTESYGKVRDYWLSAQGWVVLVSVLNENGNVVDDIEVTDRKKLWRYR